MSTEARRIFLHEPGWQFAQKVGSGRDFCYSAAPGQDFYHRIDDGELYVYRGEERLCVPCAERRGMLSHEPKPLRDPVVRIDIDAAEGVSAFELSQVEGIDA